MGLSGGDDGGGSVGEFAILAESFQKRDDRDGLLRVAQFSPVIEVLIARPELTHRLTSERVQSVKWGMGVYRQFLQDQVDLEEMVRLPTRAGYELIAEDDDRPTHYRRQIDLIDQVVGSL